MTVLLNAALFCFSVVLPTMARPGTLVRRVPAGCAAVFLAFATFTAVAQHHPMNPRGEFIPHPFDSGWIAGPVGSANPKAAEGVTFAYVVRSNGANWTRLYFAKISLDGASSIRMTSLRDGEVQQFDAGAAQRWNNTSAYFNGDAVLIELRAAPQTNANRFVLEKVAVELIGDEIGSHCTPPLCGLCSGDDRAPSAEDWAGRLLPPGCSASVYNDQSCVVSAGHCMAPNSVMQFNVPQSTIFCDTQNPPVADQFPVIDTIFQNGGVGADWAVLLLGTNNLGQTAYERYGEFRPLATQVPTSGPVDVWGYGVSEMCVVSQTQQHSTGFIGNFSNNAIFHSADTTCGNSGSAILQNDEIIGVVTHCGCPGGSNTASRIDIPGFKNAIGELCPPRPANDVCKERLVVTDGETEFSNVWASTDGPDEPTQCDNFGTSTIQNDVWYEYTATCTGQMTVSLCNSTYFTKLGVYAGDECPSEPDTIEECDLFSCPTAARSEVILPVVEGDPFIIRIGSRVDEEGDGILAITCEVGLPCPGDLTGDGAVDVADLLMLLGEWGICSEPENCDADINGDLQVDIADLLALLGSWGQCP